MIRAGIDAGSLNLALVFFDQEQILLKLIVNPDERQANPRQIMEQALAMAGLGWKDIDSLVATGRGRSNIDFASKKRTEVTCQARGTFWLFPEVRSVLNLGAESSRVISLNEDGRVNTFATNDKCAAGSGLFFDSMADLMGISVAEMGSLALTAEYAEEVSSRCAVFAESEVISHIHRGVAKDKIMAGLHRSVVDRILDLCRKITIQPEIVITGGVAKNPAITTEMEQKLGYPIHLPEEPQIVGALGAALLG
jgi:predicted CoA-substrate-specific enzyme activase